MLQRPVPCENLISRLPCPHADPASRTPPTPHAAQAVTPKVTDRARKWRRVSAPLSGAGARRCPIFTSFVSRTRRPRIDGQIGGCKGDAFTPSRTPETPRQVELVDAPWVERSGALS